MKQGGFKYIAQEQINELQGWINARCQLCLDRANEFIESALAYQGLEGKENDNQPQGVSNSMIVLFFTLQKK
ncbi:MAG TPA: hypothetical protein VMX96_00610 [Dehalococcoidia bacterium]|nr:hypothetical protein [Dehalococcoidia bacterium]